ncbi:MAG: Druantia anti-phage system protein DruA [Bacteroidota bacterium]
MAVSALILSNNFTKKKAKIAGVIKPVKQIPLDEQVVNSIRRDLERLNWKFKLPTKKNAYPTLVPPNNYDKETIKKSMSFKRDEIIEKHKGWIEKNLEFARKNLASGHDVLNSEIDPVIEVCETEKQHRLFRMLRYYWSSPYSEYVGRRIKLIIRDRALPNKPVIGIAALGSPIIHIPERDEWIGWNKDTRTKNLIYTLDAYVIGALPPYNYLLGGKLISYIIASNEIREIYREKYKDQITLKEKRKANKLVGIFTTSLYGNSSQYNRIKYNNELLYQPIGQTKGFGTLHLSEQTIQLMIKFLKSKGVEVGHKFGDGPSWVMRVIRSAGDLLGFDSNFLLKHSFKRNIYFIPLSKDFKKFLNGETKQPIFTNYSKKELVNYWKERWFENRKKNVTVIKNVLDFTPNCFLI